MTGLGLSSSAMAFKVKVVDETGAEITTGFRWQLEEDRSHVAKIDPATGQGIVTNQDPALALRFFSSHHPVADNGEVLSYTSGGVDISPPATTPTRYLLTVLPFDGYTLGGAVIPDTVTATDTIEVKVSKLPLKTAQISVQLFWDKAPINGVFDQAFGGETPIRDANAKGFRILMEDAGGGYGATAGTLTTDAFGNPLGTTYQRDPATGNYLLDADGNPIVDQLGDGTIPFDPVTGVALIKNLLPGKYGIQIVPPAQGSVETDAKGTRTVHWIQTSTIEGTKIIDAWVKANNPPFFVEFGPPGPHVSIGFAEQQLDDIASLGTPVSSQITGRITNNHMNRPPNFGFNSGYPFPACWIALNESPLAGGKARYTAPCNADSTFTIPPLPVGNYQIAIWDEALDIIFGSANLVVNANGQCLNPTTKTYGSCALGDLPVFNWFGRVDVSVFYDSDQDGFRDPNEIWGMSDLTLNLRHRNGVIYQTNVTDFMGEYTFEETFPFFNWLVAEVDFAQPYKATGATFTVDNGGGNVVNGQPFGVVPGTGVIVPQPQSCEQAMIDAGICSTLGALMVNPNTGDNLSRTEVGPVLTQGIQTFLGQTNVIEWGKAAYAPGENGGITGITYYAATRAENDPRFAVMENWEPGIPRVVVNLYADGDIDNLPHGTASVVCPYPLRDAGPEDIDWNADGCIDPANGQIEDVDGNGQLEYADADNYPFGNFPGAEDRDVNGNGLFDYGDALQITTSDSWDDNLPSGCQGSMPNDPDFPFVAHPNNPARRYTTDCFDGLRNWNQMRPAVFDGGYAFDSFMERDPNTGQVVIDPNTGAPQAALNPATGKPGLPSHRDYIVEAVTPPGYRLVKEEDRNVDLGISVVPNPALVPAECAGDLREVPLYLSMQTQNGDGMTPLPGVTPLPAPFAGDQIPNSGDERPLCDRKKVHLADGANAATDFAFFTLVPKAAIVTGIILNDLANEFNPNAPTFGEKAAPAFVPVSFRDWTGREIVRVYSDEFGAYNAILPSSWTANAPSPSGYSPAMYTACMNDAGPIKDPNHPGQFIIDPHYNRQLSQFCYTLQYMPGGITYLDTPVLPTAAFSRNGTFPVDCELPTTTPGIYSVDGGVPGKEGPYVEPTTANPGVLTITSPGMVDVANPAYAGVDSTVPMKITRDYGFGITPGTVTLSGQSLPVLSWNDTSIQVQVPAGIPSGQLIVTRGDTGLSTASGVHVTVADPLNPPTVIEVSPAPTQGVFGSIQAAIDAAQPGDLIMIRPGSYNELVIMDKPVQLQGWGPFGVNLNARVVPAEKLLEWRTRVKNSVAPQPIVGQPNYAQDKFCVLPGQKRPQANQNLPVGLQAGLFGLDEGAGITVVGQCQHPGELNVTPGTPSAAYQTNGPGVGYVSSWQPGQARIDGLSIVGASTDGAIYVAQYAANVEISNNRIIGNAGSFGGGIHVGNNTLAFLNAKVHSHNENLSLHHNHIAENGGLGGVGGGVSLYTGSDGYEVTDNYICGNFTTGQGGGIGHLGLSRPKSLQGQPQPNLIARNRILFNQNFNQMGEVSGGGIFLGGDTVALAFQCQQATDTNGAPLACNADTQCAALVPGDVCVSVPPPLTAGTGDVRIEQNLIQGNHAAAGPGGGIRLQGVNGRDVDPADPLTGPGMWKVMIENNMIVNNVAGLSGAGVSLQDAVNVALRYNTIVANDSTATTISAFPQQVADTSIAQPSGLVSHGHSPDFKTFAGNVGATVGTFSDTVEIADNIIFQNRSFCWKVLARQPNSGFPTSFGLAFGDSAQCNQPGGPNGSPYWDLAVVDPASTNPVFSHVANNVLTDNLDNAAYGTGNILTAGSPDPRQYSTGMFVSGYFNDAGLGQTINQIETTVPQTAAAFDEGGNYIDVRFGPISPVAFDPATGQPIFNANGTLKANGNYRLDPLDTIAKDKAIALIPPVTKDFEGDNRPAGSANDIGADEQGNGNSGANPALAVFADADMDGVSDSNDNCVNVANTDQRDTDGDHYGNVCDADFDNSGLVNINDLVRFRGAFLRTPVDQDVDLNGDGRVNVTDLAIFKKLFLKAPGPSGLAP